MLAADIHRQIIEICGTEAMSDSKVRKYVRKFEGGRQMSMTKNAQGCPLLLPAEYKEKRLAISLDFLIRYEEEGDDMLSRFITGDEARVSHISPESKQQPMEWRHISSPVTVLAKQTLLKRKIMATVFWERRGAFLVDFMAQGTMINSHTYCETLRRLSRAFQNKNCGMLSKGVLHLHDNAKPHTSRIFWLGGFEPFTTQPRPCSERFSPFPVHPTQSWREAFQ
ncbi:histone-lysine N-methyltransferase SETMAR [Trichonephila clavipes]|nr:histone-lysine N-methyltransferase SETMAR [Trichonephila clavipes]